MGRRPGSRNADYAAAREEILARLNERITGRGHANASFRELAAAAGVTPSTLRHYFGTREQVLEAMLARLHQEGLQYLVAGATEARGGPAESLGWFLGFLREGWERGLGPAFAVGLAEGLAHRDVGEAWLGHVLEPTLQAAEARIARHVAEGSLGPCDVRHAALDLVAPVVLACLHQRQLHGEGLRRLDLRAFLEDHVARFLAGHAPAGAGPAARAATAPARPPSAPAPTPPAPGAPAGRPAAAPSRRRTRA